MAVGMDFGTMVLVVARKDVEGKTIASAERNCFYGVSPEWENMLANNGYNFIKDIENGEERLYVVGKDALNLANLQAEKDFSGERTTGLRRPMQNMVINSKSDKKSIQMLKYMAQGLVGKPEKEGEVCVISIPANPLSGGFNNEFHSKMCQKFIEELGYTVYPIEEFLAVIYATNPQMEEDGEVSNMSGVGISWGAGGTNCGVAYKGQPTVNFALDRGGDWLDAQVATCTSLTSSEACSIKEKSSNEGKLDLENPNFEDDILGAYYIYYESLIKTVVKEYKKQFIENKINITCPIEVIISGGTSKPKGFDVMLEKAIKEISWPFDIKGIRRAKDPLASTAIGALTAAISKEKK